MPRGMVSSAAGGGASTRAPHAPQYRPVARAPHALQTTSVMATSPCLSLAGAVSVGAGW
ncbi:MAG: hypothetical protein V9G19_01645 [Tetrasphaera sp.]